MKKIIECIEECGTLADIGCDHGLIPCLLLKNKMCQKTVLVDVSEKSLNKAKKLFLKTGLIEKADFKVGSGLSVLKDGEADVAVIAGLGGMEIISILQGGDKGIKNFVLQPMKNAYELRNFLIKNNFKLKKDFIIFDKKHFYDIIIARKRLCIGGYGLRLPCIFGRVGELHSASSASQLLPSSTPKTQEFLGTPGAVPNLRCRYLNGDLSKKNTLTEAELIFGKDNIKNKTEDFIKFLNYKKIQTEKILNKATGKRREELLNYLKLINELLAV